MDIQLIQYAIMKIFGGIFDMYTGVTIMQVEGKNFAFKIGFFG